MTAQEQQMIDGLISRIRNTQVTNKDSAAEQHLQQGLAGYPDALYVLAQTVLVQQYGLQQAQGQMRALQQQNQALEEQLQTAQRAGSSSGSGGGFLSHIFGGGSSSAAQPAPPPVTPSYQPVNNPPYAPQGYPGGGGYAPASYPQPGPITSPMGGSFGSGGGFLQGALQTAAGVAAGEMMFQGMESLFHGCEHRGGGGAERGFLNDASTGTGRNDSSFYNSSDDASRQDLATGSDDRGFADSNDLGSNDSSLSDLGSGNDANFDSGSDFDSGGDGFTGTDDSGF